MSGPASTGRPFSRALVALDDSPSAERVLPWIRRLVGRGGYVHLLTVVAPARALVSGSRAFYADQIEAAVQQTAAFRLEIAAGRLRAEGLTVETEAVVGEPAAAILAAARGHGVEVIGLVVRQKAPPLWGRRDIVERVLSASPVPVLLARGYGARVA